jgi:hypothetical protein
MSVISLFSHFLEYYIEAEWLKEHDRLVASGNERMSHYLPREEIAEFHRIQSEALAVKEEFQRRVDGSPDPARLLIE